ncbi:tRNA (adenosine(37)-N6)-dimethylallyltransferase MiaA [Candidatus Uhrbacteria bacterium]|nr:tRNA (adenosine(37)-N6)-dimethylallyltransferase MiaA [Candidatus Uhrbacteria bacterium]
MKKIPLIVILGPTACGKSSLGSELAKKYNGEIVSMDSRQVYRGLDIGSGKVTKKEQRVVPHHLLDISDPPKRMTARVRHGGYFTLADFKKKADAAIADIWKRGKIPFLVGGTALYIQAVVDNYAIPEGAIDISLRKRLEGEDIKKLLKALEKVDPISYGKIDHANKRRIVRALEVYCVTGKPFSFFQQKGESPYEPFLIGIDMPREKLYDRIDMRVDSRVRQGMIREVERLIQNGVPTDWLKSLGLEYRGISEYLKKVNVIPAKVPDLSTSTRVGINRNVRGAGIQFKKEMLQKLKYAIHHFARRQMVWFRKEKRIQWVSSSHKADQLVRKFLKNLQT